MPPSNIHRKSGRMPVPASAEVIVEHIATHPCGVNPETVECPCGEATAIVCADCGEPVSSPSRAGARTPKSCGASWGSVR